MGKCFNHSEIDSESRCTQCGKDYCSECLLLIGHRKVVVCRECHGVFDKQNDKANKRRYFVIGLGLIFLIFGIKNIMELLNEDTGDSLFIVYLISSALILYAIFKSALNIYRMRTLKIVEKYKIEGKTAS